MLRNKELLNVENYQNDDANWLIRKPYFWFCINLLKHAHFIFWGAAHDAVL
jgi:hypothetical protein